MTNELLQYAISKMKDENYEEANRVLSELSDGGNISAMVMFATNIYYGSGIEKNRKRAYDILNSAIEFSNDVSVIEKSCSLRFKDLEIFSPEISEEERNELIERTFNLLQFAPMYGSTHPFVFMNLGTCNESGYGTNIDLNMAQKYYSQSLEYCLKKRGFENTKIKISFKLGRLQLNDINKLSEGAKNIIYSANSGLLESFVYAGRLFYEGKIIPKDDSKAFHFLNEAAKKGIIEAQYYLGEIIEKGIPNVVGKNMEKAIELYFSVALSLLGRKSVILESLPKVATTPENFIPIDQKSIEKLKIYSPEKIILLEQYKKLQSKDEDCTFNFTHDNMVYQHFYSCYSRPDLILNSGICSNCMKKCYDDCCIIDKGVCHCFCDCQCSKH
ncbi:hypothetical protein M9Y10_023537 [Tritrichomonas musculus]|uniref:Sel1 repeat protein n=1 Tax=Tritrichomonas musculus TaxID=1915356 RepID=A0ABR2KVH3_9EUKA